MRVPLAPAALLAAGLLGCNHKTANDGNLTDGLNHSLAYTQPCPAYTASFDPKAISGTLSPPAWC